MVWAALVIGFIIGVIVYRYYARVRIQHYLKTYFPDLGKETVGPLFPALHNLLRRVQRELLTRQTNQLSFHSGLHHVMAMVDTLPWPVLFINQKGRIDFWNAAAVRWFDLPSFNPDKREEVYYWMAATDSEFQQQVRAALETLTPTQMEWVHNRRDAQYYWAVYFIPVKEAPEPSLVVLCLDRTEQTRFQQYRSDMVNLLVHELRTPVTALTTVLDLMESGDEEARMRSLAIMQRQIERLNLFVDKLETLGRLEHTIESPPVGFDLVPLVQETIRDLGQVYTSKDLRLVNQFVERAQLMGWPDFVRVMVSNIIDNACKFSPPQGVITIKIENPEGKILFTVEDQGPGIPESEIPRVCERFYRGTHSRQAGIPGTGLGLSLVKHIVQKHSGELRVTSSVGQGTKVVVSLPA